LVRRCRIWYCARSDDQAGSAEYYFRLIDVDFTPAACYRALKAENGFATQAQAIS